MDIPKQTRLIKDESRRLGFEYCGISKVTKLEDDARMLELWLKRGMHGKMKYMENWFDIRIDPSKLFPEAKSVISLLYNYYNDSSSLDKSFPKISKYAFGEDYHHVMKDKLYELLQFMQKEIGDVYGRVFVDSGPVLERTWAARSGIGWIGKNGNLINKEHGSFYFLAELIIDLELEYDGPISDYCGTCSRCIDACPTDAIVNAKTVDGSKCISYFTIELREEIPNEMKGKFEEWMFGCDICQDVCPWNRFARPHQEDRFLPSKELLNMEEGDWEELTEDLFRKVFKDSPLKRAKFDGIKRNFNFLREKQDVIP